MKALFVSGISHSDIPAITTKVPCEALLIRARHVCIEIRISLCTLLPHRALCERGRICFKSGCNLQSLVL